MASENLAGGAALPLTGIFRYSERRAAANDEGDLTRMRLRESLAREAALLRQMRELVREHREAMGRLLAGQQDAVNRMASLTPRQRQIMELVLAGCPSKNIAADLGINQRTVETHRALIMKKTGSKSLPALARLALIAAWTGAPDLPS